MTNGTWTRVSVDDLPGLTFSQESDSKSEVRWGEPLDGGSKSGYDFEGYTTDALLDGTDFLLGRLTHHNQTIQLPTRWQFWVYLTVNVYFEDEEMEHDFTLRFRHEETPNQGAHPNDVVQLPKVHENDLVAGPQHRQRDDQCSLVLARWQHPRRCRHAAGGRPRQLVLREHAGPHDPRYSRPEDVAQSSRTGRAHHGQPDEALIASLAEERIRAGADGMF
ncbi:choice-of-anchor K domain-containing protein [Frankia sp. Mgl5]|uniref:choice-of-anchor K domain-containing protein n=1 Tax=Frankia sp. Mgl5 TaxID=2933793 RepID=UPI00200C8EA6|nr:choice-of-anchor K domain-containing protein [Frankia sp. Mgl5]MCK9932393.1 choice-of-anchor K domain-containing protein [Frankia sp. Mgl5]